MSHVNTDPEYYLEQVFRFRLATALPVNSGIHCDHQLHSDLYESELREYLRAKTDAGRADGLADMLVVYAGHALDGVPPVPFHDRLRTLEMHAERHNIDLRKAFDLVHESNMTKPCLPDEINDTELKYAEMGIHVEFRPTLVGLFACFCVKDTRENPPERIPTGKLLKSVGFREPDWSDESKWRLKI